MSKRMLLLLGILGLASAGMLITLSVVHAHPPLPASCDENDPETCLYVSDLNFAVGIVDGIIYTDTARADYPIPLLVRYPVGAAKPRPVVILHHGGNPSPQGRKRLQEWGNRLAAAGYAVIHPARVMIPDPTPYLSECQANGKATPTDCAYWVTQHRFGPQNTDFIISNFGQIESEDVALTNMFDESKIVVGGHSAGSTAVLANAGAWQKWVIGGTKYEERSAAPIAFMASGPQGPMYAGFSSGFQSGSYAEIDRPFLYVTGVGDMTGEPSETRTTGWLTSVPGNKLLSWDTDRSAKHNTMAQSKCNTPVRENHCRWIGSLTLAFVDAVARGRQEARDWLASDAYEVLTGGAIESHHR